MLAPGFVFYREQADVQVTPWWTPRWYAWLVFSASAGVPRVRVVAAPHAAYKLFVAGTLTAAALRAVNDVVQAQKKAGDTCTVARDL